MNYPTPTKLLTTRFVGADCWDRQRIKRKGERLSKLKTLPNHEQQYILELIEKEFEL